MSTHGTVRVGKVPQHDTEVLQLEFKTGSQAVNKLQDLDKIQHVISLVLNPSEELEEQIVDVPRESTMSEQVYVKQEKYDSEDEDVIPEQLDNVGIGKCRVTDQLVETSTSQQRQGKRSDEGDVQGNSHLKSNFTTNSRMRQNKIRYKVIEDGVEYFPATEQEDYQILKSDPRTRMHFVKYVKVENKTVKIWECGICGKEFRHQYTLMRHLPTHTDERNFKCEACGKAFRQMSTLSQHRAIHSDARPYVCELCKKTFNRVSTLISHRKTHSEHKPHKCTVCGKGFHQKAHGKNLRIIHLPNGDRTLADINNLITSGCPPENRERIFGQGNQQKDPSAGVIIDPINTRAMTAARRGGQTPFALLKPARGIPVLVKVMAAANNKQMLVPATAEDLKSAGKITVSPNFSGGSPNNGGVKAVQIKVPVVATVIQRVTADGQLTIEVEPPGPEQEPNFEQEANCDSEEAEESEMNSNNVAVTTTSKVQYVQQSGVILHEDEEVEEIESSVDLLEASSTDQEIIHEKTVEINEESMTAEQGLLELAATGGIQFVKPSVNGTFEVLTQEEAAEIMQQPGQTIEIVNSGEDIEADDDNDTIMNQNSLSALVDAIRAAGYQVTEDQKQIVITPSEQDMTEYDTESAVQHIVYGEPEEVMLNSEQTESLVIEPTEAPIHFVLEETGGMISEALEVVSSTV
ncbi:Transcriptional activator cubitus interruptus [Gryllus bimaculatus]|nr:Transcriptional activator cubitus interruptus [Gryllus bimaculatus]